MLGAGPAGLAAALELAEAGVGVTLIERESYVGGNASSFQIGGVNVDFGSHRLHPASDPAVLERIRSLLGEELLTRPRHGRIRLMGRWIHFPLRPLDLALKAHPLFSFGVAMDLVKKLLPIRPSLNGEESFRSVLQAGLGDTICNEFYFPYARKIWGLDPSELSPIQARKRVSAGSIGKMIRRLLPGGTGSGGANTKGIFYYPRRGFGQISTALLEACERAGVDVRLQTTVKQINLDAGARTVVVEGPRGEETVAATQVYSTIPLSLLTRLITTEVPSTVAQAADSLEFRSMTLVYLQLAQDQFTEFDAHYFPGSDIPFTRISETKNYSDLTEPRGTTVLCAEVPCFVDDEIWQQSSRQLQAMVLKGLERAGLPVSAEVVGVDVRRIPYAYPLYRTGYEKHFEALDSWLSSLDGLLSFGRQGLYAHDNTHHAMYMAKAAVECLQESGEIDREAWHRAREIFETHVVED